MLVLAKVLQILPGTSFDVLRTIFPPIVLNARQSRARVEGRIRVSLRVGSVRDLWGGKSTRKNENKN